MSDHNEAVHTAASPLAYFGVYLALLAGLGLTILASRINLGNYNVVVVLAIAFAQATLVAMYSMHLKRGSVLNKLSVGACLFVLMILVGMVLLETVSRAWGSW